MWIIFRFYFYSTPSPRSRTQIMTCTFLNIILLYLCLPTTEGQQTTVFKLSDYPTTSTRICPVRTLFGQSPDCMAWHIGCIRYLVGNSVLGLNPVGRKYFLRHKRRLPDCRAWHVIMIPTSVICFHKRDPYSLTKYFLSFNNTIHHTSPMKAPVVDGYRYKYY